MTQRHAKWRWDAIRALGVALEFFTVQDIADELGISNAIANGNLYAMKDAGLVVRTDRWLTIDGRRWRIWEMEPTTHKGIA